VSARDSALVALSECGLAGVPLSVAADASDVSIVASRISGAGALSDPRAGRRSASAALRVSRGGRVWLADVPLRGGAGVSVWPHVGMFLPSEPGAILDGGHLVVANAAAPDNTIAAGTGATPSLPVSAVAGTGTLLVDPSIVLTPFRHGTAHRAGRRRDRRRCCGLDRGRERIGGRGDDQAALTPQRSHADRRRPTNPRASLAIRAAVPRAELD
jgi:hypothetical protein